MLKLYLKRWIFLLVVSLFSLVIGLRTSAGFFLFFFWFVLIAAFSGFLWMTAGYLFSNFSLRCRHLPKAVEDENLVIELELTNAGFLPICNLFVSYELPFAYPGQAARSFLLDWMRPYSTHTVTAPVTCYKRGKYRIGPCNVFFFDPFGLFFLKKVLPAYSELYVYPRTFPVQTFPPLIKGSMPWFGIETIKAAGDDDEFYGTREYRTGDPLKTIHWISSARKNKLIVKQFQRQGFYRATLLFNLERDTNYGEGRETVCEYAVKVAASLAKYLTDSNVSVEVIAHTGEIAHIEPNKGPEHLEEIMKFLTVAQAESGVGLGEIVQEFSAHIPDDSNLIVIMIDKDWDSFLSSVMADKRDLSFVPVILLSSSFMDEQDYRAYAHEMKVKLYQRFKFNPIVIARGDNLEEAFAAA